jgi:hypothetical protein
MSPKSWLERYLPLVIALVGVISALAGATVSHFWTRSRVLEEQLLNLRKNAYSDFLRGQTLLWRAPEKVQEADQLITNAKLNILLTGSHGVICSMASYWASALKYQDCQDAENRRKDAAIYQQMRREFFKSLGMSQSYS